MTTTTKPTPAERKRAARFAVCPKCGSGQFQPCRAMKISYQHGVVYLDVPHRERVEAGFAYLAERAAVLAAKRAAAACG